MPSSVHTTPTAQSSSTQGELTKHERMNLSESASEELDAIYSDRLRFVFRFALAVILPYTCVSLYSGHYGRVTVDCMTSAMLVASEIFRKQPGRLNMARTLFLCGAGTSLVGTTLVSGNFDSEVPWLFGLIPLGVAHICGPRYVFHSLVGSAATLLFIYFLAPTLPIEREFFPTAVDHFFLVLCCLGCFCAISISSAWSVDRQVKQIKSTSVELMRQRAAVEAATHSKAAFLANMSHEIRTPMNGILGMLEVLKRQEDEREVRDLIHTAWRSGNRLLDSLNNILDFSKIEAGKLSLVELEFQPRALFGKLAKVFEARARSRGLDFSLSLPANCPGLHGDPLRIEQLLSAIVDNAIRYSQKGEVRVQIDSKFNSNDDGCQLLFRVSDQGEGISPDAQSRLFSEFETLDEGCDQRSGVGLGLVLAKHLCELMGGTLQLRSDLGKGTVVEFDIRLPVAEQRTAAARSMTTSTAVFDLKVLVVDDQAINRRVACSLLESMGCVVRLADSGESALEQVQRENFDLVLMDLHMPGQDGIETARRIRELPGKQADLRIAVSSGDNDPDTLAAAAAVGMTDLVLKPIRREQLVALLEKQRIAANCAA